MVREFQRRISEPTSSVPTEPGREHAELLALIVLEEALELCEALGVEVAAEDAHHGMILRAAPRKHGPRLVARATGPVNFVKAVDAMRDLEYSVHGTDLVLGTADAAEESFEEVHRSNMGKVRNGGVAVKATKPPGWQPPAIEEVLRRTFPKQRLVFEE